MGVIAVTVTALVTARLLALKARVTLGWRWAPCVVTSKVFTAAIATGVQTAALKAARTPTPATSTRPLHVTMGPACILTSAAIVGEKVRAKVLQCVLKPRGEMMAFVTMGTTIVLADGTKATVAVPTIRKW